MTDELTALTAAELFGASFEEMLELFGVDPEELED